MTYIIASSKITEDTLPIALALYIARSDVEKHQWGEHGTWRFISGTDKRHPYQTTTCAFIDAVAAFLLGEISEYFGEWVSETLEQIANCNNGKVIKIVDTDVKCRSANSSQPLVVISKDELNILVANGFDPIGHTSKVE